MPNTAVAICPTKQVRPAPPQDFQVFRAEVFTCVDGPNTGETLSFAAELFLDDVYVLAADPAPAQLSLIVAASSCFRLAPDTTLGTPGATLFLDSAIGLMSPEGQLNEALLLVEVDEKNDVAGVYLLPLTTLTPKTEYHLVRIDTQTARQKFAQISCVSFAKGTQITMATGEQRPIEALKPGDSILTRDDGVQRLRWVGHSTLRAAGAFAPIKICAGSLNNAHDLFLSPEHRVFIYQRVDELGAGRAEVMIKARHLVNGDSVTQMTGGFVDYVQLLFDAHQIIYAEGIAVESMWIDARTGPVLPDALCARIDADFVGHRDGAQAGLDVSPALIGREDATALLRSASMR